jgi:hypothetical protein
MTSVSKNDPRLMLPSRQRSLPCRSCAIANDMKLEAINADDATSAHAEFSARVIVRDPSRLPKEMETK